MLWSKNSSCVCTQAWNKLFMPCCIIIAYCLCLLCSLLTKVVHWTHLYYYAFSIQQQQQRFRHISVFNTFFNRLFMLKPWLLYQKLFHFNTKTYIKFFTLSWSVYMCYVCITIKRKRQHTNFLTISIENIVKVLLMCYVYTV